MAGKGVGDAVGPNKTGINVGQKNFRNLVSSKKRSIQRLLVW